MEWFDTLFRDLSSLWPQTNSTSHLLVVSHHLSLEYDIIAVENRQFTRTKKEQNKMGRTRIVTACKI